MAKATNQEIVLAAREDFGTYCGFVHKTDMAKLFDGAAVPFTHHDIMIDALTGTDEDTLLICPRGSGKTSIVQWFIEWDLGQASLHGGKDWAKRYRVLWLSHAATEAYGVSLAIKNTIEGVDNDNYKACFPKVKPYANKWSDPEWRVKGNESEKHATFKAGGIDSPPLGYRYDRGVFDDVGDQENMSTLLSRKKVMDTLDLTVSPMKVPGGRDIIPCTRWHDEDIVKWARERGFHEIYMKALIEEDGGLSSYWAERFSVEYLLDLQKKNPRAFARSFQNEVAPEEGLQFERIWFADNRFDYAPDTWLRFDSWDTAFGEGPGRSYSVGISWTVSPDWHYYVTHMYRGQIPYSDLLRAIRTVAERNRSNGVIIEAKSSGHAAVQDERLNGLPIVRWEPAGQRGAKYTKQQLADAVSVVCQAGRVHLPTDVFVRRQGDTQWLADFEHELFSYGGEPPDDIVDAFAQFLTFIEDMRLHSEYTQSEPRRTYFADSDRPRVLV